MQNMMQRLPGQGKSLKQRLTGKGYAPWVVAFGPFVLNVVSLVISAYSAHAIRWFFSPLDSIDVFEPVMTWLLAAAFAVLGYFVTRGLAFRMMNKERVWAYLLICFLLEFVEIFCNSAEALVTMQQVAWSRAFGPGVQAFLTVVTCIVWSCVPLISIGLAVLDMDVEREKRGMVGQPKAVAPGSGFGGLGGLPATPRPAGGMGPAPMPAYSGASQVPPQSGYGPVNGNRPFAGAGRP